MTKKNLKYNRNLFIATITLSVLSVIMLIGNHSYALFQNSIKNNNPSIVINTVDEFPSNGPKASGVTKEVIKKAYSNTQEPIAIDVSDKSNIKKCVSVEACEGKEIEYRYSGATVNNYIYLKDNNEANEMWRIIGVFLNDEKTDWLLKVVRSEPLPASYLPEKYTLNNIYVEDSIGNVTYTIKYPYPPSDRSTDHSVFWNYYSKNGGKEKDGFNRWEEAGLQYYLNTEHDDDGNDGYLSHLSDDTKNLAVEKTYTLGAVKFYPYPDSTPKESYFQERNVESCPNEKGPSTNIDQNSVESYPGCRVWNGNQATWKGQVGLMYPSDYGLSVIEDYWDTYFYVNGTDDFKDSKINQTSWYNTMPNAKSELVGLISPSTYLASTAYVTSTTPIDYGMIYKGTEPTSTENALYYTGVSVNPVLYLNLKNTQIKGNGTLDTPYEIVVPKN